MTGPDQRREVLLGALADLVVALRALGDAHWAEWVERERQRIEIGDAFGIGHFLAALGGMGSLNDLNIDGRTRGMISHCYDLARDIQRELAATRPRP